MKLKDLIKKNKELVWYVKDTDSLSDWAIMEAFLNYGEWKDVMQMIDILGMKKAAKLFRSKIKQKRCNLRPEIKNYFTLYFNKYA